MNRKAHAACNFNCLFEAEGLLKVTGSHVNCKSGNMSKMVQDRVVVITDYLYDQIVALPMTLGDLQDHSTNASLFKRDFSYSHAAVDRISTVIARRTVPLQAEFLVQSLGFNLTEHWSMIPFVTVCVLSS